MLDILGQHIKPDDVVYFTTIINTPTGSAAKMIVGKIKTIYEDPVMGGKNDKAEIISKEFTSRLRVKQNEIIKITPGK